MNTECISNIDIKTNNKETISVLNGGFSNFYISNVDDNGDEINYSKVKFSNNLYANFFIIKLFNLDSDVGKEISERLLSKKDITKIGINFKNGFYQEFNLAKKRIVNDGILENVYEEIFLDDDNNLCILISDKKIRYKKELFV